METIPETINVSDVEAWFRVIMAKQQETDRELATEQRELCRAYLEGRRDAFDHAVTMMQVLAWRCKPDARG